MHRLDGTTERKNYKGLNGLKAIGCCMVAFFWHYQHFGSNIVSPLYNVFKLLYQYGGTAVELFFVCSGFTMAANYKERICSKQIDFLHYIKRRIIKLWPLHIITLLVVTLGQWLYINSTGESFAIGNFDVYHFILNLFMFQSGWFENSYSFNSPAWFVSTLLLCYIVWYCITKISSYVRGGGTTQRYVLFLW